MNYSTRKELADAVISDYITIPGQASAPPVKT